MRYVARGNESAFHEKKKEAISWGITRFLTVKTPSPDFERKIASIHNRYRVPDRGPTP